MIGIDLTSISRFKEMNLSRLGKFLGHELDSAQTAAKVWCCYEALIKAEGKRIDFKQIRLVLTSNQRPIIEDPNQILSGKYVLSISHEGDLVTAVAMRS